MIRESVYLPSPKNELHPKIIPKKKTAEFLNGLKNISVILNLYQQISVEC